MTVHIAVRPPDARLRELQFLAALERQHGEPEQLLYGNDLRSMVLFLLERGYVNGIDVVPWNKDSSWDRIDTATENQVRRDMHRVRIGERIQLRITHAGRVRLSELLQALQTGRERDPFGIMLSKRHLDRDLAIAVLSARVDAPLSVAFLDMNGLKRINDDHGGHAAGDAAIRTYLQVLATVCGDGIEGYRGEGGDEAVLVMRSTPSETAAGLLRDVLVKLAGEKATGVPDVTLTASCGIATTVDPAADGAAIQKAADDAQYRAKELARKHDPRPSTLAVGEEQAQILPGPSAAVGP